ncbi:unnamed protein product [Fusarium graminearum]|uniref:Uncharacterized protein n=1 Tax=Gibberella zeae TaxID=5518 RepID=A0A2H3HB84_GIBZA|nr:hypothetical protein FGRA07_08058 [Fusarium graminearum]CAG1982563.1 unnamed protein product [Fusarium graminearum]CZS73634.1 unnamed protein product [Fusarium graminearum]
MDRLTRLPTLILTEIFVQLENESSIKGLIRAYPSMLSIYYRYEQGILTRILDNLLADDVTGKIEKDALAIIEFSNRDGDFYWQICRHGFQLKDMWFPEWPDPPTRGDLRQLHRFLSRIITFIEDYVSKATSEYPPRAYLGLPDLETGNTRFRGNLLDTRMVRFINLTCDERYRLLRHFVRYEFLCKLHNDDYIGEIAPRRFRKFNKFGARNELDARLLLSVHKYYVSLYGALFAHVGDAWLPPVPRCSSAQGVTNDSAPHYRPLMYPDNLLFDADEYMAQIHCYDTELLDAMAGHGLDLLTRVLRRSKTETEEGKTCVKAMLNAYKNPEDEYTGPWIKMYYEERGDEALFAYPELITPSTVFPEPLSESSLQCLNAFVYSDFWHDSNAELSHVSHRLQVEIWTQRGWGWFDDERLYSNPFFHFPTIEHLFDIETSRSILREAMWKVPEKRLLRRHDKIMDQIMAQKLDRTRRRSQLWQDYWAGTRAIYPLSRLYPNRQGFRFFNDTPVPPRLPFIWGDSRDWE